MTGITEIFGSMVFGDTAMKERLPKETYEAIHKAIQNGTRLDLNAANIVASAMKDWATERGATHFTHWFQPMTGITAEKHDSFISPVGDGKIIMEFSGKELIRGEPDASSFPSGGLRATFEARGYTAWDPTSYAFVKDGTLYIPTAICSYAGEALDKKTPLLRSMEALQKQALRVLKLFGSDATAVRTTVGPEQEYFLIDSELFSKRPDLIFTGRTLFGAKPPKGQELEDHYFGNIKPRVKAYMDEVDAELWRLGVLAKTEHNEVAPAQHELAPIFTTANIACDHNQIMMEVMQKVAGKHGLVCLLHEKPFDGVNGSGKHNNWSLTTDTGVNLLEPGETPFENAQFLLFLAAVIKAVDMYQDLLRITVASAANDHRLGANEAPPAVVSIYLGDELMSVLEAIEKESAYDKKAKELLRVGVHVLPRFPKDSTDRNRTSPFAFTGNKFEFRMAGSSQSVSDCNTVLNTAVAHVLSKFADALEHSGDFEADIHEIVRDTMLRHKRILFSGNGYDEAWTVEAARRGLSNLKTAPDAFAHITDEKNIRLFADFGVLSKAEMLSRYEILNENYAKVITIEATTMVQMTRRDILPAVSRCRAQMAETVNASVSACSEADNGYELTVIKQMSELTKEAFEAVNELEGSLERERKLPLPADKAFFCKDEILPVMARLRSAVDRLETITDSRCWPYPSYGELLMSVR